MKWNKAVEKIEKALANDDYVIITYHRKWMKNDSHTEAVDSISEYEWNGQICKAINTDGNQIDEDSHIIDEVAVDSFFYTHSGKERVK